MYYTVDFKMWIFKKDTTSKNGIRCALCVCINSVRGNAHLIFSLHSQTEENWNKENRREVVPSIYAAIINHASEPMNM